MASGIRGCLPKGPRYGIVLILRLCEGSSAKPITSARLDSRPQRGLLPQPLGTRRIERLKYANGAGQNTESPDLQRLSQSAELGEHLSFDLVERGLQRIEIDFGQLRLIDVIQCPAGEGRSAQGPLELHDSQAAVVDEVFTGRHRLRQSAAQVPRALKQRMHRPVFSGRSILE